MGDRFGGISVEYALLAALLGVAAMLALAALGDVLDGGYKSVTEVSAQGHELANQRDF